MKKLLSLILALAMCASLAACGGDEKSKELTELYNKVATAYNDAAPLAQENGWMDDEQTAAELAALSATLPQIADYIEGKSSDKDVDVDQLIETLKTLEPAMEDLKERVSVPYEG